MTLSEIETILEELSTRHANLDSQLLSTILLSAGWEQRNIQDALVIFKQKDGNFVKKQSTPKDTTSIITPVPVPVPVPVPTVAPASAPTPAVPTPEVKKEQSVAPAPLVVPTSVESMTFLLPDGTEEGELHTHEDTAVIPKQEKKEPIVVKPPVIINTEVVPVKEDVAPLEDISIKKEIVQKESTPVVEKKETVIVRPTQKAESYVPPQPSSVVVSTPHEDIIDIQKVPSIPLESLPQLTAQPTRESLIVQKEPDASKASPKPNHIPSDLPLIPFESSPHIWSFARYKDVFHKDDVHEEKKPVLQTAPLPPKVEPLKTPEISIEKSVVPVHEEEVEEIIVEKTPMGKEDESLVFLAGIMLLAIILILGYMYSNGRL